MVSCVIMHIPASCEVFRTGSGACNYKSSRVLQGTVCCCSAKGVIVPPMLIYPRLRVKQELLDRAPTGSIVGGSKNNWTNSDIFQKVVGTHQEARDEKVLIIMYGHSSHTRNINIINKARESNVVLLSLHSHCSHHMQPLDLAWSLSE